MANQEKHHCGSQIISSILLLGLCCPPNVGKLQKCNTCSKPPSHRSCIYFYDYLLFLSTWIACLAVCDSHTDANWHIGDTLSIWCVFEKLGNWNSSADDLPLLTLAESLMWSLIDWLCFVWGLMLVSPVYFLWVGLYLIISLERR